MAKKRKRVRRTYSVAQELLQKSREAALAAVQIFNSPTISFKSEIFIVLMNISWTYLLHAYFRKKKIEYRYFRKAGTRRRFDRTKHGAFKHWELERCLNSEHSPVEKEAALNLRFLIGIRHEIEHQMTSRIDSSLSAKFQACCLNYNEHIKRLFGDEHGIDKHLAFSLQFSSISRDHADQLASSESLPAHIQSFIKGFESDLSEEDFNHPKFAYRVLFVAKTANRKGQADEVIEFVRSDSKLAEDVNAKYALIKETERSKHRPSTVVQMMKDEGFPKFKIHHHTNLWKAHGAKDKSKGYGVTVEGSWFWYDKWVDVVRDHCNANRALYLE